MATRGRPPCFRTHGGRACMGRIDVDARARCRGEPHESPLRIDRRAAAGERDRTAGELRRLAVDDSLPRTMMAAIVLALSTFISEDLACLAAGALVARGEMRFAVATLACGLGIAAGDLLLFGAGRLFTPFAERRWPAQIAA